MTAAGRPSMLVSVVTVADDTDPSQLARLIESVANQSMTGVELVVALTSRANPRLRSVITEAGASVRSIASVDSDRSLALDQVVAEARADLIAWVAADAILEPRALEVMADAVAAGADVVYSDHVLEGPESRAALKPDFSPERLRSHDYLSPLLMASRETYGRAAPATSGIDGAELHDVALRLTEVAGSVVHIPQVLSRVHRSAASAAPADPAHTRAIEGHRARVGIDAEVVATELPGIVRVGRHLADHPLVSVVIPTRGTSGTVGGTQRCFVVDAVRSLIETSTYRSLEFVIVHDAETPSGVLAELDALVGESLVTVEFTEPFNFSTKINVGVAAASGDLLLLLNDDTELIDPASLDVMVAHLQSDDVAMVGAKLLFEDGTVQHGGHIYHHKIHHACLGWPGDSPGPAPLYPLAVERECSGVTAAAALVRRVAFDEVGGFDPAFPLNYNDVDFSLKLRAAGHRIIWTPYASWYHFESQTRESTLEQTEVDLIETRWAHELRNDPYYHPTMSPDNGDWTPDSPVQPPQFEPAEEPTPSVTARLRERLVSALLGPPSPRPRGVNLIGYLDATSGLGDRARQLAAVLDAAGIRYSTWNLDLTDSGRVESAAEPRPDAGVVFDTTIAVVTALAFPGIVGAFRPLVYEVDRVIGYWFWELEHVPQSHRAAIDIVDEIWAPTRFVRDAYAAATDTPVELVPLPVRRSQPSAATRADFGFRPGEFVFLTSFDYLSSMQRKNPVGVIDAFRQAFPRGDEPVRLVVKSINGHLRADDVTRLTEAAGGDTRIDLRDEYLDAADQAALIGAADALVSLHRSEGLGLHVAEAMWSGTAVIATGYSGSLDLTEPTGDVDDGRDGDGDVAVLIDAELVDVVDGGEAYRSGRWAEPDPGAAADAMRTAAVGDPRHKARVERALARMEAQADPSAAAAVVRSALARRARPTSRRERAASIVRRAEASIRAAIKRSAGHGQQ